MPDHEHVQHDDGHDDGLLGRLSQGTSGIHADPGVPALLTAAVVHRRRRRAVTTAVASAAAVVVLAVGAAVVVPRVGGTSPSPAGPDPVPSAVEGDTYRAAGFFADVVGGRAVPTITRYRVVAGEKFFTRFDWYPPGSTAAPVLGAVALERFGGTPGQACRELVGGAAVCEERGDGAVLAAYEIPATEAAFDPIHEAAPIVFPVEGQRVRGVVLLRTDGLAVSTLVCDCSADGGEVLTSEPPLGFEELEPVVADESWTEDVGG